jgi:hypothetical protein
VPAESPVSLKLTVVLGLGLGVGDTTGKKEDPEQGEPAVL